MYQIAPSSIPGAGEGLFALVDIPPGQRFIEYYGEVLSFKQAKLVRNRNYMKVVSLNKHIDAQDATISSPARYINDTPDRSKINCKFVVFQNRVYIETLVLIKAGQEFFVDYGRGHWLFCEELTLVLQFLELEIALNGNVRTLTAFKSGEIICAHSSLHFNKLFGSGIGVQIRHGMQGNVKLRRNPVLTGTMLVEAIRAIDKGEELIFSLNSNPSPPVFYLTGFDAFHGVENNPTVQLLQELTGSRIIGKQVWETSVEGVEFGLRLAQHVVTAQYCAVTLRYSPVVFVHFGVSSQDSQFRLEQCAVNLKHFRVPDQRGNQPQHEAIDSTFPIASQLRTRLDLTGLAYTLATQHHHPVRVSQDCGEFVCNLAYYQSLQHVENNRQIWGHDDSMFVHVPMSASPKQVLAFGNDLLHHLSLMQVSRNGLLHNL
ncbi:hypothetical protein BASA81_004410 [Batrachochytrium salamandrivorans]|nr:hypothetical protein BASA81_004410 [Batrachochytrium salamandrivorans]